MSADPTTSKTREHEREEVDADLDMGHDYDGIRELDHKLPNWWLATFYLVIVFSFGYWGYYHILEAGPLQMEAYQIEMAQAEEAAAARAAERGEITDESLLALQDDAAVVSAGQTTYTQFCAACHGGQGEGGIGPNLTDDAWLHGGKPTDILQVVEQGVPAAGMPAWKPVLGAEKVEQVTAFLLTIKGQNVPGKAPEGQPEG